MENKKNAADYQGRPLLFEIFCWPVLAQMKIPLAPQQPIQPLGILPGVSYH
jgi:hypothetical protein